MFIDISAPHPGDGAGRRRQQAPGFMRVDQHAGCHAAGWSRPAHDDIGRVEGRRFAPALRAGPEDTARSLGRGRQPRKCRRKRACHASPSTCRPPSACARAHRRELRWPTSCAATSAAGEIDILPWLLLAALVLTLCRYPRRLRLSRPDAGPSANSPGRWSC